MREDFYFETSFRFKWGVGFMIEMLEEGLRHLHLDEEITYALETQVYTYDFFNQQFTETETETKIKESTATNFVLKMSKDTFEQILQVIGTSNHLLKPQLITEFNEEPKNEEEMKRLTTLHQTYDDMSFLDSLLSYTGLTLTFPGEKTMIIEDPHPQKQHKDYQFV